MASNIEALRSISAETLERLPIEEVLKELRCTTEGLTTDQAENRRVVFGYNKLAHKSVSKLRNFFGFMWNPLCWVMEVAAVMAIVLSNGKVNGKIEPPDWEDFVGIVFLLFLNASITFYEENS
eukprot:c20968_g2_i1 orf=292-660(+)